MKFADESEVKNAAAFPCPPLVIRAVLATASEGWVGPHWPERGLSWPGPGLARLVQARLGLAGPGLAGLEAAAAAA